MYRDWMREPQQKEDLKERLENAGVPLELRTMTALETQGYRCSPFHYKDSVTGKYRELDIYATKTLSKSFMILGSKVDFSAVILAECKYAQNMDFLAFERVDKYLPAFPVVFDRNQLLGASYREFHFPMIIRKVAEADVRNLNASNNFDDRKTHEACEQIMACFSQLYEKRKKNKRLIFTQFQGRFERRWKQFIDIRSQPPDSWGFNQAVGEFLEGFTENELLREIPYFPMEIGFPFFVIPEERGLIRIKHDVATGQISDFEDAGFGIYPYVSENADNYNNILANYIEFPIIISNLGYLEKCFEVLDTGIEKMVTYTNQLLGNNPKALAAEVMRALYLENAL